jgi:hypothetical protein
VQAWPGLRQTGYNVERRNVPSRAPLALRPGVRLLRGS